MNWDEMRMNEPWVQASWRNHRIWGRVSMKQELPSSLSCFVSKLFPCGSFLQQKLTVYIKFLMQKPASSLVQLVNGTPSLLQLMLLITYQTSLRSDSEIHHGWIKNQISFINTAPTNVQTWACGERVGHNKKIVFFPLMGHVNATLHFLSIKSWLNPDGRNKKYKLIYAIPIWIT